MLYIVRHTELNDHQRHTLQNLSDKDAVILAENGVYCALNNLNCGQANCYAVLQDCLSRAIQAPHIQQIDFSDWVELSKAHQKWVNY